jgi:hypothetical protein
VNRNENPELKKDRTEEKDVVPNNYDKLVVNRNARKLYENTFILCDINEEKQKNKNINVRDLKEVKMDGVKNLNEFGNENYDSNEEEEKISEEREDIAN